jgi:hypothetical protein
MPQLRRAFESRPARSAQRLSTPKTSSTFPGCAWVLAPETT